MSDDCVYFALPETAMIPWMMALFLFTFAIAFFPWVITWLPALMGFA